jgi:hypothetical protein
MDRSNQGDRATRRLYYRAYAATQPTPRRAKGIAAALWRYNVTRRLLGHPDLDASLGPVDAIEPIGGIDGIEGPDRL